MCQDPRKDLNNHHHLLLQGWRLIDIFIAGQEKAHRENRRKKEIPPKYLNTICFFEKEAAHLQDENRRYQVTFIKYFSKVKNDVFGSGRETNFNLSELMTLMGQKGWSLVCVLDIPEVHSVGMRTNINTILVFFERPVNPEVYPIHEPQSHPGFAPSAPHLGASQVPTGHHPYEPPPAYEDIACEKVHLFEFLLIWLSYITTNESYR